MTAHYECGALPNFLEWLMDHSTDSDLGLTQDEVSALLLGLIRDVADALAHMHQHNVIHRDLACRNVLLCRTGKVVVCDFGLSRALDDATHHSATRSGLFPVTLPPEVMQDMVFRKASDVYMFTCWRGKSGP